jgi:hypothetical protein
MGRPRIDPAIKRQRRAEYQRKRYQENEEVREKASEYSKKYYEVKKQTVLEKCNNRYRKYAEAYKKIQEMEASEKKILEELVIDDEFYDCIEKR